MAIAILSTPTTGKGTTSITVNKPGGVVSGSVIVAAIVSFDANPTVTPPSGSWVAQSSQTSAQISSVNLIFYTLVCGGSEPSTYTWGFTGGTDVGMYLAAYSGVDNTTPWDTANTIASGNSATVTATALTAANANEMLVLLQSNDAASGVMSTPSGMTAESTTGTTNDLEVITFFDQVLSSSGSTGTRSGSITSGEWFVMMGALIAAPTGPPAPPVTADRLTLPVVSTPSLGVLENYKGLYPLKFVSSLASIVRLTIDQIADRGKNPQRPVANPTNRTDQTAFPATTPVSPYINPRGNRSTGPSAIPALRGDRTRPVAIAQAIYKLFPLVVGRAVAVTRQVLAAPVLLSKGQEGVPAPTGDCVGTAAITFSQVGDAPGDNGFLAGTDGITISQTGDAPANGVLAGTSAISFTQAGAALGSDVLAGTSASSITTSVDATGTDVLAATSAISLTTSGAATDSGVLVGASSITFSQSGAATGDDECVGASTIAITSSGAATGTDVLADSESLTITTSGSATGTDVLAATAAIAFSQSGAATGDDELVASAAIVLSQSGNATGDDELVASASITISESGNLVGDAELVGASSFTLDGLIDNGQSALRGESDFIIDTSGAATGTDVLVGTDSITFSESSAATDNGILVGSSSLSFVSTSVATANPALAASVSITCSETGVSTGTDALACAGSISLTANGSATATTVATGATTATIACSAGLTGSAALAGTTPVSFSANLIVYFFGNATLSLATSGAATDNGILSGATSLALSQSAALNSNAILASSVAISCVSTATLAGDVELLAACMLSTATAAALVGTCVALANESIAFSPSGRVLSNGIFAGATTIQLVLHARLIHPPPHIKSPTALRAEDVRNILAANDKTLELSCADSTHILIPNDTTLALISHEERNLIDET